MDDAASALLRFDSGALGTMEVARAAVRRPCDFTVEVNGSTGTLFFDYARLNELRYGRADDDPGLYGMRRIRAEHPSHPYAADWWPLGQGVGYGSSFVNQAADLLEGWPGVPWTPGFRDGAAAQAVCAAIEVGGMRMSQTKKLRDVQRTGRASIVVDDVLPPWQPRMIEVRGTAAVISSGGKAFGPQFEDAIVRIQPTRIISVGIESGEMTRSARSVGTS